jgi:cellulose synthase/poly-beta-1,6-N-acetylglucosamine synthase-like glycosyltransferase
MLSVLVSFRNSRDRAVNLLQSFERTFRTWNPADVEFLLIDDNSDPQSQIPQMLAEFRTQLPPGMKVTEFLFREHQHYTRALAYGFSAAKGKNVLFVSHDMMITPDYVRTLLAVAALDSSIGLVRGVSPYVDSFPQHRVAPPFALRTFDDLEAFARYVSEYWGLHYVEDRLLTGDSMLVKREALDQVGVFDSRYFGYFGDIDFGLRLQRAGLKMVCAKGAWLFHEGAAAYKDKAEQTQQNYAEVHRARMEVVNKAYQAFRDKWDKSMMPDYPGAVEPIPLEALRVAPPPPGGDFQPAVAPDPAICIIR